MIGTAEYRRETARKVQQVQNWLAELHELTAVGSPPLVREPLQRFVLSSHWCVAAAIASQGLSEAEQREFIALHCQLRDLSVGCIDLDALRKVLEKQSVLIERFRNEAQKPVPTKTELSV